MKKTVLMVAALICAFSCFSQVVDFEELTLAPNSCWTGVPGPDDGDGSSFTSSYLTLYNINVESWNYWEGFAYTNGTDTETGDYTNNSAMAGHGNGGSANYVTAYMGWDGSFGKSGLKIDTENSGSFVNRGAYFCLPTYTSKYIDDPDFHFIDNHNYYSIKITAFADGAELDNHEVVMADFRGDLTYKMDDWTYVDLSWINGADSLYFEAVTDDGATPYYFSMDDFGAQDPNSIEYKDIVDFEELTLAANSHWMGTVDDEYFTSSYLNLYTHYDEDWGAPYWEGFVYTNETDTETNSYNNLSSCVGHGVDNSNNYVTAYIGFYNTTGIKIDREHSGSFDNRGAYFCMPVLLKKYVVGTGSEYYYATQQFYFKLKASAYANGTLVAEHEIMMADFTEGHSYMMDDWTYVDLSWIENADSLYFTALSNDDAGGYGINTPLYFCMDNFGAEAPVEINYTEIIDFEELTLAPESHWMGTEADGSFSSSYLTLYNHYDEDWDTPYWEGFIYTNETDTETNSYNNFSAAAGEGNDGSSNYATCYMGFYGTSGIKIDTEHSVDFTNRGAYFCLPAYVSMYVGDENGSFAENHYYYSVKITAFAGETEVANREVVMADFREGANYKMDEWTFVDLSWIANADSLFFEAQGNDTVGGWGLNTPAYFCMDDFGATNPGPVYVSNNIAESLSIDAYFDAAGMLNLSCESRINDVYVYDIAGRLVKTVAVNDNNVSMPFDVVNGMYIISATTEKGMATCKVINNR